jgi:hypothetical protein
LKIRRIILVIITISISVSIFAYLYTVFTPSFDLVTKCVSIDDGDTFRISNGDIVRLADIDAPEWDQVGGSEASSELSLWILNRMVYLEVDDNRDPYNRLVCVVYIIHDSTNYVNVNEVMVRKGYAKVWDHPNRFNPYSWNQVIQIPSIRTYSYMGVISVIIALIITFMVNRLMSRINKRFSNFAIFRRPQEKE